VRLPWTLCIRDRVPAGAAAVLINPAHAYSDLALPIGAAQERVFRLIDGRHSLDEILRQSAAAVGADEARGFVEQLWDYDQIVLDTAGSQAG
jgi:hypothetical protein